MISLSIFLAIGPMQIVLVVVVILLLYNMSDMKSLEFIFLKICVKYVTNLSSAVKRTFVAIYDWKSLFDGVYDEPSLFNHPANINTKGLNCKIFSSDNSMKITYQIFIVQVLENE